MEHGVICGLDVMADPRHYGHTVAGSGRDTGRAVSSGASARMM